MLGSRMRSQQYICLLSLFLIASITFAQEHRDTDAENDGLAGPVKSVSSQVVRSSVWWPRPDGLTLLMPISCRDCEYDPDGVKTKSGQIVDGTFTGEIIRLVRDTNGQVTDHFVVNAETGTLDRHEVIGPLGITERTIYIDGKLCWRETFSYDEYGHLVDFLTFDRTGKQEGRVFTKREADGTLKERSVWGKDGELSYRQTFKPEMQVKQFTSFDGHGGVKLAWTVTGGKLTSFWEASDSPSQFGDNFTETDGNGDRENYNCSNDGNCIVSRVHYEYLDSKRRNPLSAEWLDSQGNLRGAVYYEYGIDSFRNWTTRKVWVQSPELPVRTLYETDSRTITYWQK